MNARGLAAVALRAWGALLLADAVARLPVSLYISTRTLPGFGPVPPSQMLGVAGDFLAGLVLVFLAGAIVEWAVSGDSVPSAAVDADRLAMTALAVVATLMIVDGLRRLLVASSTFAWPMPAAMPLDIATRLRAMSREQIVRALVMLAAGLVLTWRTHADERPRPTTDDSDRRLTTDD